MFRFTTVALMLLCAACSTIAVRPLAADAPYIYQLGTGDRVKITVFGEPTLSGEYTLDGSGAIAYPLLGRVMIGTRTTRQVQEDITSRLAAQFVRDPKVSVEVANYRPVYVLGEVARPGEFAYSEGLTALGLVAKAGGFTYRANQKVIFIRRESDATEAAYTLTGNLAIRPGDTIRIGERYF